MAIALWVAVAVLLLAGLVGTVLPVVPGMAFIFGGVLLGAWIEGFTRVSATTVVVLGALAAVGLLIDLLTTLVFAQRVGASRLGIVGAALGTVAGVAMGFFGLLFMPLIGAALGEYLDKRDLYRAGTVGLVSWLGMLVGSVVKLAIAFVILGVFLAALLIN